MTLQENGAFVYTPTPGFRGTDSFQYQISDLPPGSECELVCNPDGTIVGTDGLVHTAIGTVTIRVNDVPTTLGEQYQITEESVLNVPVASGLLSNDTDPDGDSLTAVIAANAAHGQVAVNSNGSFTYTPATNFSGVDTFTYTARDGFNTSAATTVTITVANVNDAPTGASDSYSVPVNTTLNINSDTGVLANDQDVDGDARTAAVVTTTAHGTLTLSPGGGFNYVPTNGFHGTDSFTYRVSDGTLVSTNVTVTILVNTAPNVGNDTYTVNEDSVLTVGSSNHALKNDADIDGDALAATIVTSVAHGQLQFQQDGTFTYTPVAHFNGTDTFTYRLSDGLTQSAVATVTINIAAINDAPVAANDTFTVNEDQVLTVAVAAGLLLNDTDAESSAGHRQPHLECRTWQRRRECQR